MPRGSYFTRIHPWFPVLDEDAMISVNSNDHKDIPLALWCSVYAHALRFWNMSPKLRRHPCPDIVYTWDLAVEALHEEFLAPSIGTVLCATIDMIGRPSLYAIGNIVNEGRTVSLAHVLGLNHNSAAWKCADGIKQSRIKAWWGVFVNSQWSSFAHGVPTRIAADQYDVPVPRVQDLVSACDSSPSRVSAAETFINLCALSEILCKALPVAYHLGNCSLDMDKRIRRVECELDDWEANLPREFRPGAQVQLSGTSHLWFCYLSVRLLLARASLRVSNPHKRFSDRS